MKMKMQVMESSGNYRAAKWEEVIAEARALIGKKFKRAPLISSSRAAQEYLILNHALREYEIFGALWLTSGHMLIADEQLFRGTVDGSTVHPREVVKSALSQNAAAVIIYHNHPSGNPVASNPDEIITGRIKAALALVDIRLIDHLIVAGDSITSMAEEGKL